MILSTNLQQVLGREKTSPTLALDYRPVFSWFFWWRNWLNLMFSGDSCGIWIISFSKGYAIHFLEKHWSFLVLHVFWNNIQCVLGFLLFLWWHYRSFSRPKVVTCTLMNMFVLKNACPKHPCIHLENDEPNAKNIKCYLFFHFLGF